MFEEDSTWWSREVDLSREKELRKALFGTEKKKQKKKKKEKKERTQGKKAPAERTLVEPEPSSALDASSVCQREKHQPSCNQRPHKTAKKKKKSLKKASTLSHQHGEESSLCEPEDQTISHEASSLLPARKKRKTTCNGGTAKEASAPLATRPQSSKALSKLEGAQFRWINEQLYTMTSQQARELFEKEEDLFVAYHRGFAAQAAKWPLNPLDKVVGFVRQLPSEAVVADFGCGEAVLARSVPQTVHSFDFVACNDRVTACDMAHVPLAGSSVDVCVFCLSLMGTNVSEFIAEARRVLKREGTLLVCEVESRFPSLKEFLQKVKTMGFTLVSKETVGKMFLFLNFTLHSKKTPLPIIELRPCMYKKR